MARAPLLERSLAAVNPQLAAQLHPTRNGPVTADTVSAGSAARLWWVCPAGHDWQAAVKARARGAGCPACAGPLPTPTTCLAARDPVLTDQWHPRRNSPLTPADVLPSSSRRAWWQCPRGHAWPAQVSSRTRGSGCPVCPRPRAPTTPLTAARPDLAAQWDTTANGELTTAVTTGSTRRVGWRCERGHRWTAAVYSRTAGTGCPYCTGRCATPATSLAATHPALAAQWDPTRNGDLTPTEVRPYSSERVWWRCPAGHRWQAQINQRSRAHTGCPVCTPRTRHGRLLTATRPDIAAPWADLLNGGGPAVITTGSHLKSWWRCPTDPAHRLASHPQRAPVAHRRPPPLQHPRLVAMPRPPRVGHHAR